MIAVDTNVVVRLIMRDDERQWKKADALFRSGPVALLANVLMETEWVLRSLYGLTREQIHEGLTKLCGTSDVVLEEPDEMIKATLDHYLEGFDFADSLHLMRAQACDAEAFATFDEKLRKIAKRSQAPIDVIAP